jgi:branched-subunit amino acid ABC-type transport system permease component
VATYLFAIEPYVARGSTAGWVAATLAVAYLLSSLIALIFTRASYVMPDPLPFRRIGSAGFFSVGDVQIQARAFFVIAAGVALAAAASLILNRTRFGRALRAISDDAGAASMVGVPVQLLIAAAFGLTGALAGVAAIVAAPSGAFTTDSWLLLGVKGLVAALLVRFGSPWRAFAAGVALGVAEAAIAGLSYGGVSIGPEYREVLPLAFVLLLVALRPAREALEEQE